MKQHRCFHDFIILSTVPHLLTIYYTINDIYYTGILTLATMSSVLWHQTHETSKELLYIDYTCALLLACYETYQSSDKIYIIQLNLGLLLINKTMDMLSKYRILKYNIGHGIYHIASCYKTYYIAQKIDSSSHLP